MWNLNSLPGIEPSPPALEGKNLNHWTAAALLRAGFVPLPKATVHVGEPPRLVLYLRSNTLSLPLHFQT